MHTVDDVKALGARVRNWGRWGPDDELGTLNYITADRVHVMMQGRIVRSGGPELASELEEKGYEGIGDELGIDDGVDEG